jgi:hypothetical protein
MQTCKLHSVKREGRAMSVKLAVVGVAVVALALAGCGGNGEAAGVDYASASAIATALDAGGFECTGWTPNDGVEGAREDGYCTHGEGTVSVSTYNSAEQMQAMNDTIAVFVTGVPVRGKTWQVSSRDEVQAAAVRKILGGYSSTRRV